MIVTLQKHPFSYANENGVILVGETKKIILNFTSSDDEIYVDESFKFFSNEHPLPIPVTGTFSSFKNAVNQCEDEENFKEVETGNCLEINSIVNLNNIEFRIKGIEVIYDFEDVKTFLYFKELKCLNFR